MTTPEPSQSTAHKTVEKGNPLWVERSAVLIPLCPGLFQCLPTRPWIPSPTELQCAPFKQHFLVIILNRTLSFAFCAIPGYMEAVQMIYVHFFQKCHIARMCSSWSPASPEQHSGWQTVVSELTLLFCRVL